MTEKRKHVDEMNHVEQMAYWRDLVAGKIDLSDYQLKSMTESVDRRELTIVVERLPDA